MALRFTNLLNGRNALYVYHDQTTVPASRGTSSVERTKLFFNMKMPIMKTMKIMTPHIRRANVIGHA